MIKQSKGPEKRGHIVADTLLPTQRFPRLPARATFIADTNFCVRDTKNVSDFVQKHFVSATNVSQFAQHKKHHEQQCVLVCQYLYLASGHCLHKGYIFLCFLHKLCYCVFNCNVHKNEDWILASSKVALLILHRAWLLVILYTEGCLRGKMSNEATTKEVLYKPVDIGEEDTPRKR